MTRYARASARGSTSGIVSGRGRFGLAAMALLCALCAAFVCAAPALAAAPTVDTTFNGSGTPATSFTNTMVAADESTGDVYVLDSANDVVDRFSSTGTYLSQLTGPFSLGGADEIAVDNSGGVRQGDVYVVSEHANTVYAFDSTGTALWQSSAGFGDACGVAVDASGQLWTGDYANGVQQRSVADGSPIGGLVALDQGDPPGVCSIAFDASNNLYVNEFVSHVSKYDSSDYTTLSAQIDTGFNVDVATDSTTGEVYTDANANGISVYDSSGTLVTGTPFDSGVLDSLPSVTVDGSHGRIYVSNTTQNEIQIYDRAGGGDPEPYVRAAAASGITLTDASLNATVNPAGDSTSCHFDYGTTTAYGSSAACSSAPGSGTSDVNVDAALTGLDNGTTYHYRIVATNSAGTKNSGDRTFTTLAPQHTLTVTPAGTGSGSVSSSPSGITCGATCSALLDEGHVILTATPAAHSSFTGWSGGGCSGTGTCDVDLTGDTSVTATFDQDKPSVASETATGITQTAASLGGTVNPNGAATTCTIEWGPTAAYGTTVPCSSNPGAGTSAVAVSIPALSGLTPATTYHYRVNATNTGGTTNGTDKTFATPAIPLPAVVTGAASGVTQTAASVAGTVNPNGFATTCTFQYGTTTAYGSSANCASAPGSGSSAAAVSAALSGLTAGTTYHYRLVGTSSGGTTNGADQTFTTGAVTPPPPTCPADKSLCPAGKLSVSTSTVTVAGSKAAIKVSCKGGTGSSCKGTLTLTAKVKQGKKTKTISVGKVTVNLAAGKSATFSVKLSSAAKTALAKSHKLKVAVAGMGVKKSITLKQPAKKKKKKKH